MQMAGLKDHAGPLREVTARTSLNPRLRRNAGIKSSIWNISFEFVVICNFCCATEREKKENKNQKGFLFLMPLA